LGIGWLPGSGHLMDFKGYEEWLSFIKKLACRKTVPKGYSFTYVLLAIRISDECLVGTIEVRELNE
jgi:predicted acetyltransferase